MLTKETLQADAAVIENAIGIIEAYREGWDATIVAKVIEELDGFCAALADAAVSFGGEA